MGCSPSCWPLDHGSSLWTTWSGPVRVSLIHRAEHSTQSKHKQRLAAVEGAVKQSLQKQAHDMGRRESLASPDGWQWELSWGSCREQHSSGEVSGYRLPKPSYLLLRGDSFIRNRFPDRIPILCWLRHASSSLLLLCKRSQNGSLLVGAYGEQPLPPWEFSRPPRSPSRSLPSPLLHAVIMFSMHWIRG